MLKDREELGRRLMLEDLCGIEQQIIFRQISAIDTFLCSGQQAMVVPADEVKCEYCKRRQPQTDDGNCRGCGAPLP